MAPEVRPLVLETHPRMTPRQREALEAVVKHYVENREMPTYEEIGVQLGVDRSQAHVLVSRLVQMGYLAKPEQRRVARNLLFTSWTLDYVESQLEKGVKLESGKQDTMQKFVSLAVNADQA